MTQDIDIESYEVDDETDPAITPPPLPPMAAARAGDGQIGATGIVMKPGHTEVAIAVDRIPAAELTSEYGRTIPKSEWGDGPWQNEPDRDEWRIAAAPGVPLLAVRNMRMGNWCGYVGVPEGHPWFGKTWSDDLLGMEEWQPHGGITYGAGCSGHICHVPRDGETEHVWWLGFDCAHAFGLMPAHEVFIGRLMENDEDWRRLKQRSSVVVDAYRTLDFVKAECERMAVLAHRVGNGIQPYDPREIPDAEVVP